MTDFSSALQSVKKGHKITRKGWNGKGMYVFINRVEDMEPFLVIRTIKRTYNVWVPSSGDLFADDWEVLEG